MCVQLTQEQFERVKEWIVGLENNCVPVSEDWLKSYKEAVWKKRGRGKQGATNAATGGSPFNFQLPIRANAAKRVAQRRAQLRIFEEKRRGLLRLFQRCANGEIESPEFYELLPKYWSYDVGDRLQGKGFEIKGKRGDYGELARSILKIVAASDVDRDDVAREEIDSLTQNANPIRGAFLSEMLCLLFPAAYPVLNKPIQTYLKKIRFRAPRGSSEGARYIDLARKLRRALRQNPNYPAKNLAELDVLIWDKSWTRAAKRKKVNH